MQPNKRLKKIRIDAGLTQEKFGELIGLNKHKIMSLEAGRVKISMLHAIAIEYIFNVSRNWLLTGDGQKKLTLNEDDQSTDTYLDMLEIKNSKLDEILENIGSKLEKINKINNLQSELKNKISRL